MQAFQYSAFNINLVSDINFSYFSTKVVPDIFEPFKYSFNDFYMGIKLKDSSSYFTEPEKLLVKDVKKEHSKQVKKKSKTVKTPSKPRTEIIEPSYIEYKRKKSK